ncbi:MAG: undecaprenyldiphospho-muramoylpentapeptide beta-N-acetylglucosaminyltransferase [Ilumatobacteraceae bacterium]
MSGAESATGSVDPRAVATFAVVTGGGTSGHVLPALAIAEGLVRAGHPLASVHYVGTTRGVESRLLPPTGHPFTLLDVVGLQRSLSRRNLLFVPKLVRATWQARKLLQRLRPRVVVNVGGYASFPATFAARLTRTPVVVVSYDRRPGLVSRLLARRATAVAVAFPDSALPNATLTGAPVRQSIIDIDRNADRAAARAELDLPLDRFVVAVCCGSLGAQPVNDAVVGAVERLGGRGDIAVHHVVGERFLGPAAPARDGNEGILYRVIGYEERMPAVYAAADLMITRAGAGTIAELSVAGVPAIVIPWPGAAENHQVDNARQLSDRGAAVLIEQHDLTAARLVDELERLQADPVALRAVATAAYAAGALSRSGALIALIEQVAA